MHPHRSATRPLLALGVAAAVLFAAAAARQAHGGEDRFRGPAAAPSLDANPERIPA